MELWQALLEKNQMIARDLESVKPAILKTGMQTDRCGGWSADQMIRGSEILEESRKNYMRPYWMLLAASCSWSCKTGHGTL